MDRIPSSTAAEDKSALGKIADDKRVSIAWVQHFIHHIAPHGMTDFVLANGNMSSNQPCDYPARSASSNPKTKSQSLPRQRDIRRALIEADLVDCMVALSGQLFYSREKFSLN